MSTVWNKLDPGLSSIYSNYLQVREHGPGSVARIHPVIAEGGRLTVSLHCTGNLAEIEALGFRTLAHNAPGLVTGAIDLEHVERLAAHPDVLKMSFGEEGEPMLDASVPEIRARKVAPADGVWTLTAGVFGGSTGSGVIVGIIDTGIDFRHDFFLKTAAPKTTRILRIWDLGIDPHDGITSPPVALLTGGVGAAGGTYGVEYRDNHLNDILQGVGAAKPVHHRDCSGHGTHVASIAVGDGRSAFTHPGVAPQAELVIVKFLYLQKVPKIGVTPVSANALFQDAVSYILNFASSLVPPRPVVINYSIGNNLGPHDGLTENEDFLTHTFGGAVGKVFVAAAGNESGNLADGTPGRQHARIEFPAGGGTVDIPLELFDPRTNRRDFNKCVWENATKPLSLDLYYRVGGPNITAALDIPGDGLGFRPGPALPGTVALVFAGRQCTMFHGRHDQPLSFTGRGTVNRTLFRITIEPFRNRHVLGQYVLRVTSPGPAGLTVHLWCGQAGGHGFRVALPPAVVPANVFVEDKFQVVSNGGAANVSSVAAYNAEVGGRDVAHFSSRGPLADHGGLPVGVVQPAKPDLGAPGVKVDAAKSRDAKPPRPGDTVPKSGTSMAAPHVTGLVALMLQKNAALTLAQVTSTLTAHVRPRVAPETADDIGAGRIDAKNIFDNTP